MSKIIIHKVISLLVALLITFVITVNVANAQEKGPLMFNTEVGFTLGGVVTGAAIGVIVWITDPLVVDIIDSVRWGIVGGSFLGSAMGFYVLNQAVVLPESQETDELLEELLGAENRDYPSRTISAQVNSPFLNKRSRGLKFTVFKMKF